MSDQPAHVSQPAQASHPAIDGYLFVMRKNAKRFADLMANIPDPRMTEQPAGLINHAAWVASHLTHYLPALIQLTSGQPISDPAQAPGAGLYGNGSKPVTDPAAYPSRQELIDRFAAGHAAIEKALLAVQDGESFLAAPPKLERWVQFLGTTANGLSYMLLYHESHHLSELATWKKTANIPLVA